MHFYVVCTSGGCHNGASNFLSFCLLTKYFLSDVHPFWPFLIYLIIRCHCFLSIYVPILKTFSDLKNLMSKFDESSPMKKLLKLNLIRLQKFFGIVVAATLGNLASFVHGRNAIKKWKKTTINAQCYFAQL